MGGLHMIPWSGNQIRVDGAGKLDTDTQIDVITDDATGAVGTVPAVTWGVSLVLIGASVPLVLVASVEMAGVLIAAMRENARITGRLTALDAAIDQNLMMWRTET